MQAWGGLYISICTEGRVRHFGFRPKSIKNRGDMQESASTNWRIPWFLSVGLKVDQKIAMQKLRKSCVYIDFYRSDSIWADRPPLPPTRRDLDGTLACHRGPSPILVFRPI